MKKFSQNSVKIVLCGVVGNERTSRGFGILPNKQISPASHIQTTSRKAGNANGSIGFSEVVKKIFKADVSVSGEMESVQTIDKTTTQPYEVKIQQIIQ